MSLNQLLKSISPARVARVCKFWCRVWGLPAPAVSISKQGAVRLVFPTSQSRFAFGSILSESIYFNRPCVAVYLAHGIIQERGRVLILSQWL